MKRLIAILLTATMLLALFAGCSTTGDSVSDQESDSSQSAEPSQSESLSESGEPVSADMAMGAAGYHNFCSGVGSLDLMERYAKFGYESIGFSFSPVNDESSVEKSIQNVQNLISSAISSIAYFGVADSLFYSAMQLCQEAGVYFGGNSQRPYDDEVIEYLQSCEYFVGIVADNNYQAGYQLGEYAAAQGYKTAVVIGDEVGSPNQDQKIQGFTDAFAEGAVRCWAPAVWQAPIPRP